MKDSKLLSQKQREFLYHEIKKIIIKEKTIIIPPEEIDDAINSEELNLNRLEAIKTAMIINYLKPDKVTIDCPSTNINAYIDYLKKFLKYEPKIKAEHKADIFFPEVSSASIIAKCVREEEIKNLKKQYNVEFGSLPYDEVVLTEENGIRKIEKIGDIVNRRSKRLYVYSLDKKDYKIKRFKVTNYIKHSEQQIYNILLERGKNVKLTKNHPVFVLNKDCEIISRNIEELKVGDFLAIAGNINVKSNIKKINLLNYLNNFDCFKEPIFVRGDVVNKFLNKSKKKLQKLCKKLGYGRTSVYSWVKLGILPINIFKVLTHSKFNLSKTYITSKKGNNIKIPILFPIDKDFLYFLGIYIAEGWIQDYNICVSSKDKKVFEKVIRFAEKYKINHHYSKDWIALGSIILIRLIKSLCGGNTAKTKKVPEFLFSCDKKDIKHFLDAVYEGDGYFDEGNFEIELYNESMIKQIAWLQLMLGNVTSYLKRKTREGFVLRNLSKSTNSLSPDNIPVIVMDYIKSKIKENIIPRYKINKLLKVKSLEKRTLIMINKTLKDIKIQKLINSEVCWLRIKFIKKLGKEEVYDLEVKPNGKYIENFLGGNCGIILHNSGYPSDPVTQEFLKKNYNKYNFFRKTWATYRNVSEIKKQKSLTEF